MLEIQERPLGGLNLTLYIVPRIMFPPRTGVQSGFMYGQAPYANSNSQPAINYTFLLHKIVSNIGRWDGRLFSPRQKWPDC